MKISFTAIHATGDVAAYFAALIYFTAITFFAVWYV